MPSNGSRLGRRSNSSGIPPYAVSAFMASGQKTYIVQFRRDGRSHRVKIGAHGPITPEQARTEAKRLLGRIVDGADPNAEKRERRAARTVSAIAEEFLRDHVDELRKPRTAAEYRRLIDLHIRPRPAV